MFKLKINGVFIPGTFDTRTEIMCEILKKGLKLKKGILYEKIDYEIYEKMVSGKYVILEKGIL